jgi:hypothetical protein
MRIWRRVSWPGRSGFDRQKPSILDFMKTKNFALLGRLSWNPVSPSSFRRTCCGFLADALCKSEINIVVLPARNRLEKKDAALAGVLNSITL